MYFYYIYIPNKRKIKKLNFRAVKRKTVKRYMLYYVAIQHAHYIERILDFRFPKIRVIM